MQTLSNEEIECIAAVRSFKERFDTTFVPAHPFMDGFALADKIRGTTAKIELK